LSLDGRHIRSSFKRPRRPSRSSRRPPPESGLCWNLTTFGHCHRIPATFAGIRSVQIPATRRSAFGLLARIRPFCAGFRPLSRNPVKVAGILPISEGISSSVIFILFYINISMLWKTNFDFYKLIWLNENIKNICDFSYALNTGKYFR
jgi:hypothetical protein